MATNTIVRYADMSPEQRQAHDEFTIGLAELVDASKGNKNEQADNLICACLDAGHHNLNQICSFGAAVGLHTGSVAIRLKEESKKALSNRRWYSIEGGNYYLAPASSAPIAQPVLINIPDLRL